MVNRRGLLISLSKLGALVLKFHVLAIAWTRSISLETIFALPPHDQHSEAEYLARYSQNGRVWSHCSLSAQKIQVRAGAGRGTP